MLLTAPYADVIILVARILLTVLFLVFGWRKARDQPGTVAQMSHLGVVAPALAAAGATFMELPVAFAVALGVFTQQAALLMAAYTLGTALIGHRFWKLPCGARVESMDGFLKNLAIIGGFLLLSVTGPGRYSIDALWGRG